MANNATKRIAEELNVSCTLYALTRNRGSILRPYIFYLSVDDISKKDECKKIINEEFREDKLIKILEDRNFYYGSRRSHHQNQKFIQDI